MSLSFLHRVVARAAVGCGVALSALAISCVPAPAATLTWDPGLTTGTAAGGTGTWNVNSSANWFNVTAVQWTGTDANAFGVDTAVFGGTSGTVTLSGSLAALGLTFTSPNYTLQGSGTLVLGSGGINASATTSGATTIGAALSLLGSQTWSLGSGATLSATGSITRNVGSTVDFSSTGTFTGAGLGSLLGGTPNGWATVDGSTWAFWNGSSVAGLASGSYTASTAATTIPASTADVDFQASNSTAWTTGTINSLRFNTAGTQTLTISSSRSLTVASGGILVTSSATGPASITSGTIRGASGTDLVVIQNSGTTFTIGSLIANNTSATGLTKSGTGTLVLTNASNSFTGPTVINAGSLTFTGAGRLSGATAGTYAGNIAIGQGASLVYSGSQQQLLSGTVSGAGSLTMAGSGMVTLSPGSASNGNSPGSNAFTGGVTLSSGTLRFGSGGSNALGTGPLTISGGVLSVWGNNTQTLNNSAYTINNSFSAVAGGGNTLNFFTGNVTLGATPTVTVGSGLSFEINGIVGDGGNGYGITAAGAGTLLLTNSLNTYTGKTSILGGILAVQKLNNAGVPSTLGAPTGTNAVIDMFNGATLRFDAGTTSVTDRVINLASNVSGTVAIWAYTNDAFVTLNNGITATGSGAKTLALNIGSGSLGDRSGITVAAPITDVADGSVLSLTGTINANNQDPTYGTAGSGINLSAVNTFTGPITFTAGVGHLSIRGAGQLGSGSYSNTITLNGGEFNYASTATQTLSGSISGSGNVRVSGPGMLSLSASNTYTGTTTVVGGVLRLSSAGALPGGTGTAANAPSSALVVNGGVVGLGAGDFTRALGTGSNQVVFGAGGGGFAAYGADRTVNLGGLSGTVAWATGTTGLSNMATLTLGAANVDGTLRSITVANPIDLSGTLARTVQVTGGTATLSGVLSGTGAGSNLTKTGNGVLILSAANTYSGTTAISAGTLQIGAGGLAGSLASTGTLTIGNAAALVVNRSDGFTQQFAATNLTAGVTTVAANATNGVDFGTITRSTGATLDLPTTGSFIASTTVNSNNILGRGITIGGTSWAVANGSSPITGLAENIYALTTVNGAAAGNYSNANVDVNSSPILAGAITANSLRFSAAAANTLTLTGSNVLGSGGILVTPGVGANASTIAGGQLGGASGGDLVVVQNNTAGSLTIGSGIVNNTSATALTKSGAGTLVLAGLNTYTGATYVNSGTLQIGGAGVLGAGAYAGNIVMTGNGGLVYASTAAGTATLSGVISGTNGLTVSAGLLNLTGVNTFAGPTAITGGTLQVGGAGLLGSGTYAGAISIAAGAGLTYASTATGTLAGVISGGGNLVKGRTGTLVLAGVNTYTGTTTLAGGLLSGSTSANFGAASAPIVFAGGGLQVTGTALTSVSGLGHAVSFTTGSAAWFDIATAANTFTVDQAMNLGAGGLTKGGVGTLVLNQANTIGGPTLVTGGMLAVSRADTVTQSTALGYVISGSGGLANVGAGTLVLDRLNFYSGLTRATSGTIQLANAFALRNSAIDTTGAGRFTFSGTNAFVIGGLSGATGNLSGIFDATTYGTVSTLTLSGTAVATYGGVISNGTATGMNLTIGMIGNSATQTLTGVNTYTGTTTFAAATLALSGSGAMTNSSAYVFSGGNLTLTNVSLAQSTYARLSQVAPITSNGGTLTVVNTNTNAIPSYSMSAGAVALSAGQFNVHFGTTMTVGGTQTTQTLTFAGLSRAGTTSGSTATVTFSANGGLVASGSGSLIAVTNSGSTAQGGIVGPWATVGTSAGTPTDYAFFNNGYVVPANYAATNTESSWVIGSGTAYTFNSVGINLGGTRSGTAFRYTGISGTLAIGVNQLQTYGILNAGSGLFMVSGSSLTTPAGGGNLFLTTNASNMTVSGTIADAPGGVPVSVVTSGNGTVTLSGQNTFTGGVVVNAGTLYITSDGNLGNTSGGVTFNNSVTWSVPNGITLNSGRTVTLNNGAVVSFVGQTTDYSITMPGKVTGSGGISMQHGSYNVVNLSNTGNDFTGPITVGPASGGNQALLTIASLADSASPITLGGMTGNNTAPRMNTFLFSGAAAALVLNNRYFVLGGSGGGNANIANDNGSAANTLTVNTDVVVTSSVNRNLYLQGTNTGTNVFAGRITNGPSAVITLFKHDAGTWLLSGTNTYSGGTTLNNGTLLVSNSYALGVGPTTLSGGTLLVGQGAGVGTNIVTFNGGTLQATGADLTVPIASFLGAGSTISGTQSVTLAGPFTNNGANTLTNNITPVGGKLLTISGMTYLQPSGGNGVTMTLAGTGNTTFTGPITGGPAGNGNFTITNSGLTILSASNTYTGTTTAGGYSVVRLDNANALPGGVGATGGGSNLAFTGGVIGLTASTGDFMRSIGAGPTQVLFSSGSGGFAAYGADRVVNFGGASGTVAWATASTGFNGVILALSATSATHTVDVQNPISLAMTGTVAVADGGAGVDARLSGVLSGAGGLTKTNTGLLQLTATNTFTGGLTVSTGTVQAGVSGTPFGVGTLNLGTTAGATVDLNNQAVSIGALTGGGAAGGTVVLNSGTLTIGATGQSGTYSGAFNGSGSVVKTGAGILGLTPAVSSTFSGFTINQGLVSILPTANITLGTGTITRSRGGAVTFPLSSGTVATGTPLTNGIIGPWATAATGGALRYATVVGGTVTLYTSGSSIGAGNFANLSDTNGTINYDITASGVGTAAATFSGNTIRYNGGAVGTLNPGATSFTVNGLMNATASYAWTIGTAVGTSGTIRSGTTREFVIATATQNVLINSVIADSVSGSSALTFTSQGGALSLLGANTFSGDIYAMGGSLTLGSGSFHAATTGNVSLSQGASLTVNNNGSQSIGNIVGVGSTLTKTGSGVLTMSSATSSYTGSTTISTGTVEVSSLANYGLASSLGAPAVASGTITMGHGTLLRYVGSGSSTTNRAILLSGSAARLEASGAGPLVYTGTVAWQAASGTNTLTLGGSSMAANVLAGAILNPTTSGTTSVDKTGSGTWWLSGTSGYTGQLRVLQGTIVAGANVLGSNNASPFGLGNGDAALPRVGDATSGASGTAALLLADNVSVGRSFFVESLAPGASQVAVLGGLGSGSSSFTAQITVSRDVTLQAGTGGTVTFGDNIWASGTIPTFTIGSAGNAGTVAISKYLANMAPVKVVLGTGRLGANNIIDPVAPVTVGSSLGAATLDLGGYSQALTTLGFAGSAGLVSNGTLRLGVSGTVAVVTATGTGQEISSAVALDNVTTFAVTGASDWLRVSGSISNGANGGQSLTKDGAGTLELTGANSYTGATMINSGTLRIAGTAGALDPTGGISGVAGTLLVFNRSGALGQGSGFGSIAGGLDVTQLGPGTVTLAGGNSYTGTTRVSAGVLALGASNAIPNASALVVNGGGFDMASFDDTVASVLLTNGSINGSTGTLTSLADFDVRNGTIGAILGGSVGLAKTTSGTVTLTGASTYSGATTIAEGLLLTSVANALPGNSAITLGSATTRGFLEIDAPLAISSLTFSGSGGDITDGSVGTATFLAAGSGTATITVLGGANAFHADAIISSPTLLDVVNGAFFTFHNNIAGNASFTKSGLGTLNITGDNDGYGGNFFITGGLVTIGLGMNQIGTGTTTLSGGATIDLGGQAFTDQIVVLDGTILNAGGTATTTTILGPSSIDGSARGTYNIASTGSAAFTVDVGNGGSIVSVNVNAGGGAGGQATFASLVGTSGNVTVLTGGTATFGSTVSGRVTTHGVSTFSGTVLGGSEVPVQAGGSATFAGGMAGHADVFGTATFSGALSGTADVFGSATFGSTSSLTGRLTTDTAGTALLDDVSATVTAAIHNDGTLTVNRTTGSLEIASAISGVGNLVKNGAGALVLSAANTYSGATTVAGGVLRLGVSDALSNSTALAVNGGGFDLNGNDDTVGSVALTSGSIYGTGGKLTAATYGLAGGTISTSLGGGTVTVTGNASLAGTSDATSLNLSAGALTLVGAGRFTAALAVTGSSGASLSLGGNEAFGSLSGAAGIALGANRLTVGGADTSTSYSGEISGLGGLTKTGLGTMTFTAAQTYAGSTIISGGTLALDAYGSFANSSRIVVGDSGSSGAVLDLRDKVSLTIGAGQTLQGKGTVLLDALTALTVSGTFSPGNSPGLITLDGGTTTLAGTTLMEIWGTSRGANPGYDAVNVTNDGSLILGGLLQLDFDQTFGDGTYFDLFTADLTSSLASTFSTIAMVGMAYGDLAFTNNAGLWSTNTGVDDQSMTFDSTTGRLTIVAAIPEPSTLVLAGLGLAGLAWRLRRRRAA